MLQYTTGCGFNMVLNIARSGVMKRLVVVITTALLPLAGCGGGGGGAVNNSAPVTTTNTYTTLKSNTVDATFNSSGAVTGHSSVAVSNTSAAVTTNASNEIVKLVLTNSSGSTTFSSANGDTIEAVSYYGRTLYNAYNSSKSKQAIIYADNNNGSSAGNWYEKDGNTGYVTAFHSGSNPTSDDPATLISSATYNGTLSGMLSEVGYTPVYIFADVVGTANFNTKSISLSSTGSKGYTPDGGDLGAYATQDFTVTLNDGNSDNNYEGSTTDSEGKSGNVSATLYGNNAEVLAGVGTLANGDDSRVHSFAFSSER